MWSQRKAVSILLGTGPPAFAFPSLAVWEFHCQAPRLVASPPGHIQDTWQQTEGEKSELAQLTSYWLALVPMATSSRKGGWESGSLNWHIAVISELDISRQGKGESRSWGGTRSAGHLVLLPIIRQACAGAANSFLCWLKRNRSGTIHFPYIFLLHVPFPGSTEGDCPILGFLLLPCIGQNCLLLCAVSWYRRPLANNDSTYNFLTLWWCKSIQ